MLDIWNVPYGVSVKVLSPRDADLFEVKNWSLKPLQHQEDVSRERSLSRALLYTLLGGMQVGTAYAPAVATASARIVSSDDLSECLRLGMGAVRLFRNPSLPADGTFINPFEAFVMSGAGCPLIIASGGRHLIVAHAGRDSLIDRGAVLGRPTRFPESVVVSIIDKLKRRGVSRRDIAMTMLFAIPTMSFEHRPDHPQYGEFNRALSRFVSQRWPGCMVYTAGSQFLDIEALFVTQAHELGVDHVWATHSLDQHPDLAHTRDGEDPSRRNLFIVKRHG